MDGINCIGCAISSHGNKHNQISTFDKSINLSEFFDHIGGDKCQDGILDDIPKLFFIQVGLYVYTIILLYYKMLPSFI